MNLKSGFHEYVLGLTILDLLAFIIQVLDLEEETACVFHPEHECFGP